MCWEYLVLKILNKLVIRGAFSFFNIEITNFKNKYQ